MKDILPRMEEINLFLCDRDHQEVGEKLLVWFSNNKIKFNSDTYQLLRELQK